MAKMNYEKARRVADWTRQTQAVKGLEAAVSRVASFGAPRRASERQISYLQALLAKTGRRPYTADEMAKLTIEGASRMIAELTGK